MQTANQITATKNQTSPVYVNEHNAFGPDSLLTALLKSDPDLVQEIATIFIRQEPMQRRNILGAILKRDRQVLTASVHSLRGSLSVLGIGRASRICEAIETTAETIDFGDAYKLFESLEVELRELKKSLKTMASITD